MSSNKLNNIELCNSLYGLLQQCEVRIPIIQRDYAQGRNNNIANEVRKRLLDDILYVFKNKKQLDFNFVYGNKTGNIFYPVDGQQRLTTLYLLHWFLACRAGEDYLRKFNNLNTFSYMTRSSASEFFTFLKDPNDEFCCLIKASGSLIEKITDYAWFRAEWNNDPTVIAALNMLNDMINREEFKNNELSYYETLTDTEIPAVYFKVLIENGENAETTETAAAIKYIRMNARGKVLTNFENVKAMLDGIDEKLMEGSTKIIFDYDTSFIDIFYNKASEKYKDMDTKTEDMDKQTMCFFRNMYNVVATINRRNEFCDETNYANEMYRYSQERLEGNDNFFTFYFNIIEAVLRVRKATTGAEKFIDAAFEQDFQSRSDYRNYVAYFLYMYHLYINHNKSGEDKINFNVSIEKIEKFEYVLNNLMFLDWEDSTFIVIYRLAEEVAKAVDVFDYFESKSPDKIIEVISNGPDSTIGLPDIEQRIKEQHIKSKIIAYKKYKHNIFGELEERSRCRKIQYLLWISGLWVDNLIFGTVNDKKIDVLEEYMNIALRYFMVSNEDDELIWRKLFAIGGNWDETGNKLLDSDTINANTSGSWEKCCYWVNSNYFWNDSEMPNEDKLSVVKKIYDLITSFGEDELFRKVEEELDNTCWLKYAILKNHKELLINKVKTNDKRIHEILLDGTWRRFMPFVLLLEMGYPIVSLNYTRELDTIKPFSGFGMCHLRKSLKRTVITLEANKTYKHSNRTDIFQHNDWRNYNITLEGSAAIKFANASECENIVSTFDSKIYKIYEYQEANNDFLVQFYSLNEIKKDIEIKSKEIDEKLKEIHTDVSNGNFDRVLEIKDSHDRYWKHWGSSRTWKHEERLEYELNKEGNYEIML